MVTEIRSAQNRMVFLLMANLVIAFMGPVFVSVYDNDWDYLLAFVIGIPLVGLYDRRYFHYLFWSTVFVLYLGIEIVRSNIILAWMVIQPRPQLDPGIIAVPLTIRTGLEITVLATAITLTPGTITVDLGRDKSGNPVLYVHDLKVRDPENFRASIKNGFERMILRISEGATS